MFLVHVWRPGRGLGGGVVDGVKLDAVDPIRFMLQTSV